MEDPLLVGSLPEIERSKHLPQFRKKVQVLLEEYKRRRGWRFMAFLRHEHFVRCFWVTHFCLVFAANALLNAAPHVLVGIELLAMLLVYLLAVPDALFVHQKWVDYEFDFGGSTEDLICVGLIRSAAIIAGTVLLPGLVYSRPYLMCSIIAAGIEVPYVSIKLGALNQQDDLREKTPGIIICSLQVVFCLSHVAAAQSAIAWARRRARLGLPVYMRTRISSFTPESMRMERNDSSSSETQLETADVDPDSFMFDLIDESIWSGDIAYAEKISVHYKIALPHDARQLHSDGIILIHPFGGGVHSWRHVMQPLAEAASVGVIAFDRPGFGLTSRPPTESSTEPQQHRHAWNPYSLQYHAVIAMRLSKHLKLRRVAYCGIADGALIAVLASTVTRRGILADIISLRTNREHTVWVPIPQNDLYQAGLRQALPYSPPEGSLAGSLDLSWMGSVDPGEGRELLRRLLRGQISENGSPPKCSAASSARNSGRIPTVQGIPVIYGGSHVRERRQEAEDTCPCDPENPVHVVGVALVHSELSGRCGASHTHIRALASSGIGQLALRRLLSGEIGNVADRRSWSSASGGPDPEVVRLYRRQLRRRANWETGLVEVCKAVDEQQLLGQQGTLRLIDAAVSPIQEEGNAFKQCSVSLLLVRGEEEGWEETLAAQAIVSGLEKSRLEVLPRCARLSHEEQAELLAMVVGTWARECFSNEP